MDDRPTEFLFSYGTLQLEAVQMALFGRRLSGRPDVLPGFAESAILIDDPETVALSGKTHHSIVRSTGNATDSVAGTVFALTPEEIARADEYEVSDYKRVAVLLGSGIPAWVYVDARYATEA